MKRIWKAGQWIAFFVGIPFILIGRIGECLMEFSDLCHDRSLPDLTAD